MTARAANQVRAIALVGPSGTGKTCLAQQLAAAASGASIAPENRGPTTDTAFSTVSFLDDRFTLIDTPGSAELAFDMRAALPAADLALVVIDADPEKAALVQPFLKEIERLQTPHAIFVNKIDSARGAIRDLLAALQPVSASPLVARQIPIWRDGHAAGFVDLALERAYMYKPGAPSERVDMPADLFERETEARFQMLEALADFDDALMEQLLSDEPPSLTTVFSDLVRETQANHITPVLFGAAQQGFGVRRLLKALRHDAPMPQAAAGRLADGAEGAYVVKVSHAGQAGKLTYARVFSDRFADGAELSLPDGAKARASGAADPQTNKKTDKIAYGETIALGKIEGSRAGMMLSMNGPIEARGAALAPAFPVYQLAIAPKDRKDDVKLSAALANVVDEDGGLGVHHDGETHEIVLQGQGDTHLRLTLEKLKKRYNVDVTSQTPSTPYKETIRRSLTQRGRHKKQSGGHGQFGDVVIEVKPRSRGEGFAFQDSISGGVVPKQWIPAVEQGVRDAMDKGPLGFPVVDVGVTLTDGSYHAVDSSEIAFRLAGRAAMLEALQAADPFLLEPIEKLSIFTPNSATSKITSALSGRHGQVLGFAPRDDWPGWDVVEAYLPHAERQTFIIELRSLTQGLATFESAFDHRVELTGRRAEDVLRKTKSAA
ncbi:MAG: elongation factor G [Alphaproteobacteria bacterium]|nr:elongation factor G [Alphaproteobacteria bacterium]